MRKLILASRSPRRRELLILTGITFEIIATDTDETRKNGESPIQFTKRLSRDKAKAAAAHIHDNSFILAADTIVVDGELVLGKPADAFDAVNILQRLRGRTHQVYTGITLLNSQSGQIETDCAASPVMMRNYSDQEIQSYIATGDPFDKAGAYAIQHAEFHPAESFSHCFANVMGLPLCHVARLLRRFDIHFEGNLPERCQANLGYECSVYTGIIE